MNDRFPTRTEAVHRLYDIVNSGIISEELESDVKDIIDVIDSEKLGLDIWGAKYENVSEIFVSVCSTYLEPTYEEEMRMKEHDRACAKIIEKYGYEPISCRYDVDDEEIVEDVE